MKLLEAIKNEPKKKSLVVGILAAFILIAIIASCIIASVSRKTSEGAGGGNDSVEAPDTEKSIAVFNPIEDTQSTESAKTEETEAEEPEDTLAPIDVSGIHGLNYVSLGNGTCAIEGIGTCTLTQIEIPTYSPSGDKVVKINDGAFEGCRSIVKISIPASVRTIGTGAFRGCKSLSEINVSGDNPIYSSLDGVLFSEDKSVLICVPMSISMTSYHLSTDVRAIAAFAFEDGSKITSILYEGSVSDFQRIEVLEGNDYFKKISITLNYVPA